MNSYKVDISQHFLNTMYFKRRFFGLSVAKFLKHLQQRHLAAKQSTFKVHIEKKIKKIKSRLKNKCNLSVFKIHSK